MAESQNIEYKESWRDEYLKWLCCFANAQGGTIYIGIDDGGNVVGVKDVKKLMEDIPNKIQSGLGIVADVNKHTKDGKDYLERVKNTFLVNNIEGIPVVHFLRTAGYFTHAHRQKNKKKPMCVDIHLEECHTEYRQKYIKFADVRD